MLPTVRRSAMIPVSMCRDGMHPVGQERPRQATVEVDPQPGAGEAGVADRVRRTQAAADPTRLVHVRGAVPELPAKGSGGCLRSTHLVKRRSAQYGAGHQVAGEVQYSIDIAEQSGMAGSAQREGIFVMDLAAYDPPAPGTVFGGGAIVRIRSEC